MWLSDKINLKVGEGNEVVDIEWIFKAVASVTAHSASVDAGPTE